MIIVVVLVDMVMIKIITFFTFLASLFQENKIVTSS